MYFSVERMVKLADSVALVTPERARNQPEILPTACSWASEGLTEV